MSNANELVISGLGAFSSRGYGLDAHWHALTDPPENMRREDYFLSGVQIRDYITDRRMLKAISTLDGIGLASILGLKTDLKYEELSYDPYRVGIYVGSVPSSLTSIEPYLEAMSSTERERSYI